MRTSSAYNSSSVLLYRMVFATWWVSLCVLVLLISILIQPVERAFAQEMALEPEPEAESVVEEASPEPEPEVVEEEPEPAPEEVTDVIQAETVPMVDETPIDASAEVDDATNNDLDTHETAGVIQVDEIKTTEQITTSTSSTADKDADVDTATTVSERNAVQVGSTSPVIESETDSGGRSNGTHEAGIVSTVSATTSTSSSEEIFIASDRFLPTNETNVNTEIVGEEINDSTEQNYLENLNNPGTTTSSSSIKTNILYVPQVESDPDTLLFNMRDCAPVDDGSYYCNTKYADEDSVLKDQLFASLDSEGDTEIYLQINGELKQLSDNSYDDLAPEYDTESGIVVWHRLIDDRYQIILYDLESEEEYQLTAGSENSMEPKHEGDYTVWQRWVNNNWEIILFDGDTERQLTFSAAQDVTPDIRQGFVVWNITAVGGRHSLGVYEIDTGEFTEIEDSEGGQVTNPRFVLMYDTKFANGDIITKGFNTETGELEPLSAVPGELPAKIPSPDQTGETQALIQTKSSSSKEDIEKLVDDLMSQYKNKATTSAATSSTQLGENSALPFSNNDGVTETTIDLSTSTVEVLPLTEFDLIVEPFVGSSTTNQLD